MSHNDPFSSKTTTTQHIDPWKSLSNGAHLSKNAFLTAPEERIGKYLVPMELNAGLTVPVELVTDMVAVGLLFADASKTFKALSPPQNEFLSPVHGILQLV